MKKEEILEKARAEQSDEMEHSVQSSSMWCGAVIMAVFLLVFSIIRRMNDQISYDLTATVCAGVAAENLFQYKKLGKKKNLAFGLAMSAASVLSVVWFFIGN